MLNLYQKIKTLSLGGTVIMLTACQQHFVLGPTEPTEADLVANSIGNGLSQVLNTGYEEAYKNLHMAYSQCMAFTSEKGFVFTDNKFEPDLEMGTLFGRSKGGVYLYKATVESINANQTTFTLYLPQGYKFAQTRFKQDVLRAQGKDPICRIQIKNSTKESQ